jgi:hypothetical protein
LENSKQLQKIEPIEFTPSQDFYYAQALQRKNSWWKRAWHGDDWRVLFPWLGFTTGCFFSFFGMIILIASHSGWVFGIFSGVTLLSLGGMHLDARRTERQDQELLSNSRSRFLFQVALGVEAFNRRAKAWNGLLAALELGAEDKMSQEEKENIYQMLVSAREELSARVQLAEGLMLPTCDHRPQVAGYLEELRDAANELPGQIAVPEKSLRENNFQEILENEAALFGLRALSPKKD